MNWQSRLTRCVVMSFGLTLLGCGSASETSNQTTTTTSQQNTGSRQGSETVASEVNLVTLELPGMT